MFKYIALATVALTSTEAIKLHSKQKGENVKEALLAQASSFHRAHASQITEEDAQELIDYVDADGNGTFDLYELEELIEEEGLDPDEAYEIWDACDADEDDSIDASELADCLNAMYE